MTKNILGICFGGHDTSAALMIGGELVSACEEERYNRDKHTRAFPINAIKDCLKIGGIAMQDINEIAIQLKSRAKKLAVSAAATTLELLQNEQCDKNIHAKLKYFALNFLIQSLLLVKYQIQHLIMDYYE